MEEGFSYLRTLRPAPCALHLAPYALCPAPAPLLPCALRLVPCALCPAPCALCLTPFPLPSSFFFFLFSFFFPPYPLPLSGKYTTTWAGLIGSSTGLSVHPAWLLSQKMIAVVLPSRQRS